MCSDRRIHFPLIFGAGSGSIHPVDRGWRMCGDARLQPKPPGIMVLARPKVTHPPRSLVLVNRPLWQDPADLQEIVMRIRDRAPEILPIVLQESYGLAKIPPSVWQQPALTVSFAPLSRFRPPRGPVLQGQQIPKLEQYRRFLEAGLPTPKTARFEFGRSYSESHWGEFVILKPLDLRLSSKGGQLKFLRTRRLKALRPEQFPPDHYIHKGGALLQSYIDTGQEALMRRVLSLCGRPLYTSRSWSPQPRADLTASDEEIEASIVDPKHPELKARFAPETRRKVDVDAEALAFATKVHAAFPEIPLIGCDILREYGTGKLYVLELNAGGNTWHFSSHIYTKTRAEMGGRDVFVNELGAWKIAAEALIAKTRELAR
jgi:hypothetical protein